MHVQEHALSLIYSTLACTFINTIITNNRHHTNIIRRGKLNSQFIVTDFSILHVGGWSLFRFQTSKRVQETLGLNLWSPRSCPSIAVLEVPEKIWKSMRLVTINCEFSLSGLIAIILPLIIYMGRPINTAMPSLVIVGSTNDELENYT